MTPDQMQDAKRSFGNLSEAIYQLKAVFQQMCENMSDLHHRLDKLDEVGAEKEVQHERQAKNK